VFAEKLGMESRIIVVTINNSQPDPRVRPLMRDWATRKCSMTEMVKRSKERFGMTERGQRSANKSCEKVGRSLGAMSFGKKASGPQAVCENSEFMPVSKVFAKYADQKRVRSERKSGRSGDGSRMFYRKLS